jgi:hypothetical protein
MPTEWRKTSSVEDKIVKLEAEKTETKKELSKELLMSKETSGDNAKLIQEVGKSKLEVGKQKCHKVT